MSEKIKNYNNYDIIDIVKFIFAIFVVGIHTEIMNDSSNNCQWYILHMFFRSAVPFFFVCTGFFFWKKAQKDIKTYQKKQLKRLFIPFAFWMLVSFPYVIVSSKYKGKLLVLQIIRQIIFYPWGALWFVLASMVAIIIISYLMKKIK